MILTQTVEIPANRRLTIEVPREVPAGNARVIIQFPARDDAEVKGKINNEAFRSTLRRAQGAWKNNPV